MLLLRVFLLVMLIRGSSGQGGSAQPTVALDHCKEMACLVPKLCITNTPSDTVLHKPENNLILPGCKSILKIRSYSEMNYLMVMESYDIDFHTVELEYGAVEPRTEENKAKATRITCHRDDNTLEVTASLKKGDISRDLALLGSSNAKPLRCEFYVKADTKIFEMIDFRTDIVKLITPLPKYTLSGSLFQAYIKPTCDPDAVQPAELGSVDNKTVSRVDVKLDKLECSSGQRMMFRKDQASAFEEVRGGIITCEEVSSNYQFKPKLIEARCEVTTCNQCRLNNLGTKGFETFDKGGCTKLKCKNDMRVKFGDSTPIDGIGVCKFENNKHVWKLNETTIDDSTDVKCAEKLKCFSSQADVDKACENCILGNTTNLPVCSSPTAVLKWKGTTKMDVHCNDATGKYSLNYGKDTYDENILRNNNTLKCVDDKQVAAEESAKKEAEAAQMATIVGSTIGGILGLAAVGGIVFVVVHRGKKKKAKKEEEEDEKKWKMKNALEEAKEKKSEDSKGYTMKQLDEIRCRQANATGGQTEVMDEETRFGGDTAPKPKSDWQKALESQRKKKNKVEKDDTDPCHAGPMPGETDATGITGVDDSWKGARRGH